MAQDEAQAPRPNTGALDGYNPWRFFRIGMGVLFCVALISTVFFYVAGYYYGKDWSFLDCLFMVVITLSTIGYGDWLDIQHIKNNQVLEIFTMFLAMAGMGVPAFIISNVTALIMDGILSDTVRRRRMRQEIAKLDRHVIVCGAGGTGEHCIGELIKLGRKFVVIDGDLDRIKSLHGTLGAFLYVVGRAEADETLTEAGVQRAEGLICCLTEDKDNLFVTLSAKVLNPELRIASKGIDDHVRKKMVIAGANSVVSPTAIGGLRLVSELLRPATVGFLDNMMRQRTNVRFDELTIKKESQFAGKTLASVNIRNLADVLVVAARHPGQEAFQYNPKAEFLLEPECVIVVMGQVSEVEKLRPMFEGNR
jgi:voltage-gated potassium channel